MSVLRDLIVSVRQLRIDVKLGAKDKVPIEVFIHDPSTGNLVMQNWEAIKRLANVDDITNVEEWRAKLAPSRGTAHFDVRLVYEPKIDVAAERARLKKELEQIEKEIANGQRQLGNEQFLAKAPAKVVDGIRKRAQELAVLREKAASKLGELR